MTSRRLPTGIPPRLNHISLDDVDVVPFAIVPFALIPAVVALFPQGTAARSTTITLLHNLYNGLPQWECKQPIVYNQKHAEDRP